MATSPVTNNDKKEAPAIAGTITGADELNDSNAFHHSNQSGVNDKRTDPFPQFPAALKREQRWCLYKHEYGTAGKLTKVPYRNLVDKARSNNPHTWISYDIAVANYRRYLSEEKPTPEGKVAGIGIFANGSDTFIDFDKCCCDGILEPWADKVFREVGSYAEYSPSGDGVHGFALGTVAEKGKKVNGCEIYSEERFLP